MFLGIESKIGSGKAVMHLFEHDQRFFLGLKVNEDVHNLFLLSVYSEMW